jgi:hypothetical protein
MSAPVWSFDDGAEIVNRLHWGGALQQQGADSLENKLLQKLDVAANRLFLEERNTSSLVNLPKGVKTQLIRHPYVAGYLCGQLQLNARELQSYVSGLRWQTEYAPSRTDVDGGRCSNICGARADWLSTIKIDRDNTIAVPSLADGREWLTNYEEDEFGRLVHEMEWALSNVAQTSASAHEFICNYIWNLSIRKNTEKIDKFGTYTFPMLPGFLLICNPHSDSVDRLLLEETLLHESIHCFLDWVEAAGPKILRKEETDIRFVQSPWTSNPLDIPTAFHATLVWFGLGEYFKRCVAVRSLEPHQERFASRLEFVRAGFRSKDFVAFRDVLIDACNKSASNVLSLISERRLE